MATTINNYSVGVSLNTAGLVDSSKLARNEVRSLTNTLRGLETPAEKLTRDIALLEKAHTEGAIGADVHAKALDRLQNKLNKINNSATKATSSVGNGGRGYDSASGSASKYTLSLTQMAAAATATAAAIGGTIALVRNQQNAIDDTIDSANKLGIEYNELKQLRFAAQEGGGMEAASVDAAVRKMQINIAKAIEGDEEINAAFARLGLKAGELLQAGPVESVKKIADAMQGVDTNAEKLNLTMQLFGKSGVNMVDTLSQGSAAIQESIDFQAKWNSLTETQLEYVAQNNDAWDRVSVIIEGTANVLAAELAPAMQIVAEEIIGVADGAVGVKETIEEIVSSAVYFAGVGKDVYEIWYSVNNVLKEIASGDFTGATKAIEETFKFDSGQKALDELNAKREKLAEDAAKRQEERDLKRQKALLSDHEDFVSKAEREEKKKEEALAREREKLLADEDRKREQLAQNALKNAQDYFENERKRAEAMQANIAKGPGAGIGKGTREEVAFLAERENLRMSELTKLNDTKPTDEQLLEKAKEQLKVLAETKAKTDEQTKLLASILKEQQANGFKRIR